MKKIQGGLIIAIFLLAGGFIFAANGEHLYKRCSACHGKNGSKKALRVASPLKGQPADMLFRKMKGYQNGTYGGKKRIIMKRNVAKLTDKELRKLADFIATF